MVARLKRIWGGASAGQRQLPAAWIDLLLLGGIFGMFYGLTHIAGQWGDVKRPKVEIDLSLWMLPWYTFQSLMRGIFAYILSLLFTLVYGYWAAKDARAERVLVPTLDILQSIPVLGFMPGLILALVAIFPHSNTGLELAAILMIFTGQVWNMTFSLYRSVQTVPREQQEAAQVFGFGWLQRIVHVELPFATLGLVWNSMMSMAGGWFFLTLCESFQLGDQDFRLPGLGSYMKVASNNHDLTAQIAGNIAMLLMIVGLDQLLWRPMVAWAQKFRVEEGGAGEVASSWFLDWLLRSHSGQALRAIALALSWPVRALAGVIGGLLARFSSRPTLPVAIAPPPGNGSPALACDTSQSSGTAVGGIPRSNSLLSNASLLLLIALVGLMAWGLWGLLGLLIQVSAGTWGDIAISGGVTLLRVVIAVMFGTLWAIPAGLAIGLSPRLSRMLQPIIQIAASYPASMLFPAVILLLAGWGIPIGTSSVVLMVLGTQWYIVFNVIAGAMTIPSDLREAAHAYGIRGRQRLFDLYLPAIFPYLVTGWVTAMGGAWNTSIVAEYMTTDNPDGTITEWSTLGLGAMISHAATVKDLPTLAASVVFMSVLVVGINRTVWKRLYRLSETTFTLDK